MKESLSISNELEINKRIEYLWNAAKCTIYCTPQLSMRYIAMIRKITNNTLNLCCICCHKCNLLFIPNYNCKVNVVTGGKHIIYKCSLCKTDNYTSYKKTLKLNQSFNEVQNRCQLPQKQDPNKIKSAGTTTCSRPEENAKQPKTIEWNDCQKKLTETKEIKQEIEQQDNLTNCDENDTAFFFKFDDEPNFENSNVKISKSNSFGNVNEKKNESIKTNVKIKNKSYLENDRNKNEKPKRSFSTMHENLQFINQNRKKKKKQISITGIL